jgi:microcystin-dependent protein
MFMSIQAMINGVWTDVADIAAPSGAIMMFGGAVAPGGFLLCQGQAVSRTIYAALFQAIGTTYGAGDGVTTFNVPNFQGVSPTGSGSQSINGRTKAGPTLGQVREDQAQGHIHQVTNTGTPSNVTAGGGSVNNPTATVNSGDPIADTHSNGTPRTGPYTHGPELSVNFIIKT